MADILIPLFTHIIVAVLAAIGSYYDGKAAGAREERQCCRERESGLRAEAYQQGRDIGERIARGRMLDFLEEADEQDYVGL